MSVAGANTLAGRLVARLGEPVPGLDALGLTHTFPSAATLADADLAELGLTRRAEEAIRAFARAVADDAVRLDRSVDLDTFVASVTAIDGLGPWTGELHRAPERRARRLPEHRPRAPPRARPARRRASRGGLGALAAVALARGHASLAR